MNKCDCSSVTAGNEVQEYKQSLEEAQFRAMIGYWLLLTDPALYEQEKPSKQVCL
jgi:hypothetical protein